VTRWLLVTVAMVLAVALPVLALSMLATGGAP
jgi:hypothetical protein